MLYKNRQAGILLSSLPYLKRQLKTDNTFVALYLRAILRCTFRHKTRPYKEMKICFRFVELGPKSEEPNRGHCIGDELFLRDGI